MASGVSRASHAHVSGRLDDCETFAQGALTHRFTGNDEIAGQIFGGQLFAVREEQGRLDELVPVVEGFVKQYPQFVIWRCALAYLYAQLKQRKPARRELEALAHANFSDLQRDTFWLSNMFGLTTVVVFLGDASRAQLLYNLLAPYADRCIVTTPLLCRGSASRLLGLLATTLSQYEKAEQHFQQAVQMNARIGSQLWTAHTHADYAHMLLLRDRRRDRDKALQLLNEALATADQLGLKALGDKARPLKLAAEADTPPSALQGRA